MSPQSTEPSKAQEKDGSEITVKRNPHPDFHKVQKARPDWDESRQWHFTKTRNPSWTYGSGASEKSSTNKPHVSIDPYAKGRPAVYNYKLLISGIVPRPIGFLSTISKDGSSTNLAPFSYTQVFNHDPPIFGVGFTGGLENAKDTLKNLLDTDEVVINIVSDHFLEAANACAIDLRYGQSEWVVSGLTPAESKVVAPSRVKEAVFSIEGKLLNTQEFESRTHPGKKTGVLAVIEGVNFWVREDAINEEQNLIDPAILRPISRLGGITYARVIDGFEILRPVLNREIKDGKIGDELLKPKVNSQ